MLTHTCIQTHVLINVNFIVIIFACSPFPSLLFVNLYQPFPSFSIHYLLLLQSSLFHVFLYLLHLSQYPLLSLSSHMSKPLQSIIVWTRLSINWIAAICELIVIVMKQRLSIQLTTVVASERVSDLKLAKIIIRRHTATPDLRECVI